MSFVNSLLTIGTTKLIDAFVLDRVEGVENIEKHGAQIVIANHGSYFDHFVLLSILRRVNKKRPVYFLTKKEAFDKPFSKWWHKNLNCIPVDRDGNATQAMLILKDKLKNESATVVIYPEGTRTPTGEMFYGKQGAETLAYLTGVSIVPVGMHGVFDILSRKKLIPNMSVGKVSARIGEKISISKQDRKDIELISDRNIEKVSNLAREPLNPSRVGEFSYVDKMIETMISYNERALRNYPNSYHTPFEYYNRVLIIGQQILKEFELSGDDKVTIFTEMARSNGRIAYESGLRTVTGKRYLKLARLYIDKAKMIRRDTPELLYVEANFYNFVGENTRFLSLMEKLVLSGHDEIKYLFALAKAKKIGNDYKGCKKVLTQIGEKHALSQVDERRKVEALALLMRIDPDIEMEINYGA